MLFIFAQAAEIDQHFARFSSKTTLCEYQLPCQLIDSAREGAGFSSWP